MADTISLTGVVATLPRHITTTEGLGITSFRLASSIRRFDRQQNSWVDMGTNWYTVTAFRQLASNLAASIAKGDRVVVTGRLRLREWESGEKSGMTVELDAEAIGHDLHWGTSRFTRSVHADAPAGSSEQRSELIESRESDGFFPAGDDASELLGHAPVLDSTRL